MAAGDRLSNGRAARLMVVGARFGARRPSCSEDELRSRASPPGDGPKRAPLSARADPAYTLAPMNRAVSQITDEALRRDQQVRRAMEIARIGSWEWEVAADRVHWSEELYAIYGVTPDSFPGTVQAFLERLHPEDRPQTEAAVRQAIESGEPFDFQERILRPDGSLRVLHSQGEVVRDAEGRALRLFGVCQDVTEQVAAQEQERNLAAEHVVELGRLRDRIAELTRHVEGLEARLAGRGGGAKGSGGLG
jgi:PAS domain S-box-containing protein